MTRELTTDLAVMDRLIATRDRDVVDVGCGRGALVRQLSARGARAVGLETSEEQLGDARERSSDRPVRYVVGRAEALPFADRSLDVVLFMLSLHHVPMTAMAAALHQGARVLRSGGVIYVAEPLTEGGYYELVRIVADEAEVRAAAQAAVQAAVADGLERVTRVEYEVGSLVDMVTLRRRIVNVDPERAAAFNAHEAALTSTLARVGEPRAGGRWLTQPMRADVLSPRTAA